MTPDTIERILALTAIGSCGVVLFTRGRWLAIDFFLATILSAGNFAWGITRHSLFYVILGLVWGFVTMITWHTLQRRKAVAKR